MLSPSMLEVVSNSLANSNLSDLSFITCLLRSVFASSCNLFKSFGHGYHLFGVTLHRRLTLQVFQLQDSRSEKYISATLSPLQNFVGFLLLNCMDSQGPLRDVGSGNPNDVSTTNPPARGRKFRIQRGRIPPAPFFQGFPPVGSQMPFLFPHSFMPPVPGVGFAPPTQGGPSGTIDLTAGSQKRGSQECVTDPSKSTKKRRVSRKKPKIVELDDVKDKVELLKTGGHWKDHWVIQLITIRREMHSTFSAPPKQGVDNWSRVHTKLVSLCPDFMKDSEACRKKWSAIYNDYKEDKAMNMKSGSQRSEKCRWYQLVDEFMFDRANVVSHAHASAMNADALKSIATSDTNTTEQRSGESTSKSPEPKRKEDIFMERCIGEIRESSKSLMESLKASDDMKMALLMSMQQTMQKLVEKL